MEVDLCALADHANVTNDGKLNIVGVFDGIRGRGELPLSHPSMSIALRLRAYPDDANQLHRVRTRLQKPDGGDLFRAEGGVQVGEIDEVGGSSVSNLVFDIRNLEFPEEGAYQFQVFVDGELKEEKVLRIAQAEE